MCKLKREDPATWERLKKDPVVSKSTEAFVNLFIDQALEQEIKEIKRHGHLPGLTQDEEGVNRFITVAPYRTKFVEQYLSTLPKSDANKEEPEFYHQLKGNVALRCALNSIRLKDTLIKFCKGNPLTPENTKLRNIASGVIIPDSAADDIINYPDKGQARYEKFIEERLKEGSPLSVWDRLPQLKLKRFSNWAKAKKVKVGNKVLHMKEDRAIYSRIIKIAQTRPELIPKMPDIVSNYEMSVIPRQNFSPDGTPLMTHDKSHLMKQIINQRPQQVEPATANNKTQVLVVDAMPEVHNLKKRATTIKLSHLKKDFINRISRKAAKGNYREIYVAFDEWWLWSFKDTCRNNREGAAGLQEARGFDMHDEMCIKKTSVAELIGSRVSKSQIAHYFSQGLLDEYKGSEVKLVVTCAGKILINQPHSLPPEFTTHSHEEADTQMPLLISHSLSKDKYKHFDVYSPDTDVLVELMDLVSNGVSGALTGITMHAGTQRSPQKIDIRDRVRCVGIQKSRALLGFHIFTGDDHGNKYVGISKQTWCKVFFNLPDDSPIIDAFVRLGTLSTEECSSMN